MNAGMNLQLEQPKKIDMIMNLRGVTEMGLNIPFGLLSAPTKVV